MATSAELDEHLYDAIRRNDIETATALGMLKRGTNINSQDVNILNKATAKGNKALVECLLCRGAAINRTGSDGYTALVLAAKGGHEEIVDLLLQKNAGVDKKSGKLGWAAIHLAALNNYVSIINRLISCGATVDIVDDLDRTPLWYAAGFGRVNSVDVLFSVGANPHHRSKSERSPLDFAKKKGRNEVVERLNDTVKCRVMSLQFQIKRFMWRRYNCSQILSLPLPARLTEWLGEQLH